MSHSTSYDNYIRILPTAAYEGHVLAQVVIANFGWTRVVIFSTRDDVDCSDPMIEFSENANLIGINILRTIQFSQQTQDYSSYVASAFDLDPRVIVIFMKPANAAPFLETAYKLGLLKPGVTVLGTSYTSSPSMYPYFSDTTLIPNILNGYIGIASNLNWTSSAAGQAFIRRWQKQSPTVTYTANGTAVCNNATDDSGEFYLYQAHIHFNASLPFVCAGLNFSHMDASNIFLYAGYAYDAVYAAAYGLEELLYNQGYPKVEMKALKSAIVGLSPFQGVTGEISFSPGRTSVATYGIGDRITGYNFNVFNFDPTSYAGPHGQTGFDVVGTCAASDGLISLVKAISFNTADGAMPSDRPPDIVLTMPEGTVDALRAFAYLLIAVITISIIACYYFRNTDAVRVAQPSLFFSTLIGCYLICARLIVATSALSESVCTARIYLTHIGYYFVLGSITAKMWRLHLLCNVSQYRKVDTSERTAWILFYAGFQVLFLYLVLLTSIKPPEVLNTVSTSITGQNTIEVTCYFSAVEMEYVLLVVEVLLLLFTIGLCLATMRAPERVNEFSINIYGKESCNTLLGLTWL